MLSYRYISFKVDWYLVSSQLYFTINLEEIFYFNNKKYRIYAVFGVSQTPSERNYKKEILLRVVTNKAVQIFLLLFVALIIVLIIAA